MDKESEIQEMETMIERLERRKAQMQRDLERAERDGDRASSDQERSVRDQERMLSEQERARRSQEQLARSQEMLEKDTGPDYQAMISQLQREGLLEGNAPLSRLTFDTKRLKVNGKTASAAAHQRLLEIYQQQTGEPMSKGDSVKVSINNN